MDAKNILCKDFGFKKQLALNKIKIWEDQGKTVLTFYFMRQYILSFIII